VIYIGHGKFDAVVIMEAPNEKAAMKSLLIRAWAKNETLIAIPAEARNLVE